MREAVARCRPAATWSAIATALPLEQRLPRPQADRWQVEVTYTFPPRHADAMARAFERGLAGSAQVEAFEVGRRGGSVTVRATVAARSAGRAQGAVDDALEWPDLGEDIGWTTYGGGVRPA
jgi:hypothetical protein